MDGRSEISEDIADCIRHNLPRFLATATRILRDRAAAQDAVQDACVLALQKHATYSGDGEVSAWLHRIVVNAALTQLRKRKRRGEEDIDALLPSYDRFGILVEAAKTATLTPEALAMRSDLKDQTRAAIDTLPDRYRMLVVLRDLEEFSTQETAALLSISEPAVKTGLHRARLALKTLLTRRLGEDFP